MFCGNCGKEIDDNSKFCQNCGCPIQQNNVNSSSQPVKTENKENNSGCLTTFVVICLIFVLIAVIIGVASSLDNSSASTSTGSTGTTVVQSKNYKIDDLEYFTSNPSVIDVAEKYGVPASIVDTQDALKKSYSIDYNGITFCGYDAYLFVIYQSDDYKNMSWVNEDSSTLEFNDDIWNSYNGEINSLALNSQYYGTFFYIIMEDLGSKNYYDAYDNIYSQLTRTYGSPDESDEDAYGWEITTPHGNYMIALSETEDDQNDSYIMAFIMKN